MCGHHPVGQRSAVGEEPERLSLRTGAFSQLANELERVEVLPKIDGDEHAIDLVECETEAGADLGRRVLVQGHERGPFQPLTARPGRALGMSH